MPWNRDKVYINLMYRRHTSSPIVKYVSLATCLRAKARIYLEQHAHSCLSPIILSLPFSSLYRGAVAQDVASQSFYRTREPPHDARGHRTTMRCYAKCAMPWSSKRPRSHTSGLPNNISCHYHTTRVLTIFLIQQKTDTLFALWFGIFARNPLDLRLHHPPEFPHGKG